jgi:hypothetical protein
LRVAIVIALALAAIAVFHTDAAYGCAITPLGPGLFRCDVNEALDPPCPSLGDGKTTYLYFLNIPSWAQDPTFGVFDSGGSPFGSSSSPCPHTTFSGLLGQDNAPDGSPGPDERSFKIQFDLTPGSGATGGQTPNIDLRVDYHGAPAACVSPTGADFGTVEVGTTVTRRFTVTNCGHAPLVIDRVDQSGGEGAFAIRANLCQGATIQPGQSCTFDVDFAPTEQRDRVATLTVVDNAGDSPQAITVQGTGVPPSTGGPGGPGGGATPCPGKPALNRPCADVYISSYVNKGITQVGDHQNATAELTITNLGPDRSTGMIEAQTKVPGVGDAVPVQIAYDLGPGETLTQPVEAIIVSDDAFDVFVRVIPTTPDPDLSNNGPRSIRFRPPTSTIEGASKWSIRGIAKALADLFSFSARAAANDRITRVDVAVRRLGGKPGSCSWLRDRNAHFKTIRARHGRCDPSPVWQKAKGTSQWSLRFRRRLPPGRYVAFSRARDAVGLLQVGFSASEGRARAFRIR